MEPNWNRLWATAHRKICTRDEFVAKFDEVHDNNPEEVYFKISKRQVSYDN